MARNLSQLMCGDIGQVFTPIKWAEWLINKWNIFDSWQNGAYICDPTAGQGVFALALLRIAKKKGVLITPELISRLSLIEIVPFLLDQFRETTKKEFGINFPNSQIYYQDVITEEHKQKYDILIGNPPWVNFGDLPDEYKTILKPYFIQEGLVHNRQRLLLGSSRVDIAALVLKVVIGKLLNKNGSGYFYVPTSLFFGEGAHNGFRNYNARCSDSFFDSYRDFSIDVVYEFATNKVFDGVNTTYCCAKFQSDKKQEFPVKYFKEIDENWVKHKAVPLKDTSDPWRIINKNDDYKLGESLQINLDKEQKPRQGVNTCGANSVFIFDSKPSYLPDKFLFPLVTKEMWRTNISTPIKWILLPYDKEIGKPLTWYEIEKYDNLRSHLQNYQVALEKRKGTLLRASINRGNWWSLLGVGPYSFAPYKVIWEAYGKDQFNPIVLSNLEGQMWQGNQAMHAFIPCWHEEDALRIKSDLENPAISELLHQLNGAGKCNWAQPGKIKKILSFGE